MINRIYCASIVFVVLAFGFLLSGILLSSFSEKIIKNTVNKECQLRQGTVVYNLWRNSPVPWFISIYVFDLINQNDFINGAKPIVIQRGPFVYREDRFKENIGFYPNGTISYQEKRNYTFDRSLSVDDESFNITTINVVYMTLMNYLQSENVPAIVRLTIEKILGIFKEGPVMQRTVKEYLWGYQDPVLNSLKTALPLLVSNDQVSVFASAVNEAQYETYLINNGVKNILDVGAVERFNFSNKLSIWSNDYANMINGTDSTIWHPNTNQNELFYSFMNDICRSVHLKYNQTHRNPYGIDTYRYILPKDIFANTSENEGFCLKDKMQQRKCLPDGLFSLTTCIHLDGNKVSIPLPIIASNPHFLDADPSVQNAILGLAPDEILHRSFADVEPVTGIVMNGTRRMQFNINVINDSSITTLAKIKPLVYPMIWVNEQAQIDKAHSDIFHKKVFIPLATLSALKYVLLSIGTVFLISSMVLFVYKRSRQEPLTVEVTTTTATDETTPLIQ